MNERALRGPRAFYALLLTGLFAACAGGESTAPEEDEETIDSEVEALTATNGLTAQYFDEADFTIPKVNRVDPKVDFSWTGVPADGMGSNYFSVRWTGQVLAKYSETYRFYTVSDDGVRLWVNGKLLVDHWTSHGSAEDSGTVALVAGQKYDIKLEYWEKIDTATIRLKWSSPSQAKQVVPTTSLFPTSGGTGGTGGAGGTGGTGGAGGTGGTGGSGGAGGGASGPTISGCPVFPADNAWNQDVSSLPVDAKSSSYINYIMNSGGDYLKADFGSFAGYGIPYTVVSGAQPKVPVSFDYADESDPGPYPIPATAPIEGGVDSDGDRHVLVVDKDNCLLYETWDSHYVGPGWQAGSGAVFDLRSNALRPDGWTSADAAGLPVLPGLVRYEEAVTAQEIKHALRFTVAKTQRGYIHPATHFASSITDTNAPPMGLRLRLKSSFDLSSYSGPAKVILTALKKYGMILADNGSNWFISGMSNPSFNDDQLHQLQSVPGTAFEVVSTGPVLH